MCRYIDCIKISNIYNVKNINWSLFCISCNIKIFFDVYETQFYKRYFLYDCSSKRCKLVTTTVARRNKD